MNRRTILTLVVFGLVALGPAATQPAEAGVYVSASYGYTSHAAPVVVSRPVYVVPAPVMVSRPVYVVPAPVVVSRPVYVAPAPVVVSRPVYVAPRPVVVHRTHYARTYAPVVYHRPVHVVRHYHRPHGFGFRLGFRCH